jgi:FHA domain
MDILRKLRGLESRLARTVDAATQKMTQAGPREPLEVLHAIVETVEKRIEPAARGKYVFPFNRIRIRIATDSRETRARFEAVLASEPTLQERIVQTLEAASCESTGLSINAIYVDHSEAHWPTSDFNVEFDRITVFPQMRPQANAAYRSLKLRIVQGATEKPAYVFTTARINLGRCPEVRDHRNRLIRTNHVAFTESDGEANRSVSRHHAHIDCTGHSGEYRLCDDRSAHGTSVLRNGATIAVPPGPRGVRLQPGDEITLGEARLHVEIETP